MNVFYLLIRRTTYYNLIINVIVKVITILIMIIIIITIITIYLLFMQQDVQRSGLEPCVVTRPQRQPRGFIYIYIYIYI